MDQSQSSFVPYIKSKVIQMLICTLKVYRITVLMTDLPGKSTSSADERHIYRLPPTV